MAGETIEWRLILKDEVNGPLASAREKMLTMNGALKEVSSSVDNLRLRQLALAEALALVAGAADRDEGVVRALRRELEQTTDSLSRMTGATQVSAKATQEMGRTVSTVESALPRIAGSSRNAGQAVLEFSRGFEDLQYGIGGVVNNVPSLVSALGGGAGLAGAISVAAVLSVKLYGVWQESRANANVFNDSIKSLGPAMTEIVKDSIEPTRTAVKDLLTDLKNFGKDARQIGIDAGVEKLQGLESGQERLSHNIFKARQRVDAIKLRGEAGDLNTAQAIVAQMERRLAELPGQIAETRALVDTATAAALGLDAKEANKKRTDAGKDAAADLAKKRREMEKQATIDAFRTQVEKDKAERAAIIDANNEKLDLAKASLNSRFHAEEQGEQQLERLHKKHEAERLREAKKTAAALANVEQRYWDMVGDMGQAGLTQLQGSLQDYIEMKVAGEQNAELKATAAFMKGVGSQLVGIGLKGIFEGAVISANPATPGLGAGMIATGVAAVAVGASLGAGGAAIAGSVSDKGGGGARSSGGVSSRRGRDRRDGDGGPAAIQVTQNFNGVSGGDSDKGVKTLRVALKRLGRR